MFFRTEAAEKIEPVSTTIANNPLAGPLRCLDDHVHAVCVRGEIAESHHHLPPDGVALEAQQLTMRGRQFGFLLDTEEISRHLI